MGSERGRRNAGRPGGGMLYRPRVQLQRERTRKGEPENTAPRSAHHFLAAPELSEELLHRGGESVIIETVNHVLPLPLVDDQIRLLEDRKMTRDGRLRQIEVPDDLANRTLASFQQTQDLLARSVRQRLEDFRQMPLLPTKAVDCAVNISHGALPSLANGLRCPSPQPHLHLF